MTNVFPGARERIEDATILPRVSFRRSRPVVLQDVYESFDILGMTLGKLTSRRFNVNLYRKKPPHDFFLIESFLRENLFWKLRGIKFK